MEMPKVTFRAMTFEENMDMIAMFIRNEINQDIKPNTDFFNGKYPEIANIDFDNMYRNDISNILISKLSHRWHEETKNI